MPVKTCRGGLAWVLKDLALSCGVIDILRGFAIKKCG